MNDPSDALPRAQTQNLAMNYLQYTTMLAYRPKQLCLSLAEYKRIHHQAHWKRSLRSLMAEIKK
ncbi:hypothetical protein [uncultured Thermanaerothrix sp.]|uniref:hypothetical protein n=1 Tax=uncultured Thermanaerothrix sp. TaxID=1195149 RepID=UPI00260FCA86|nr:hypothetical protein [uncultured Thermanaerothrix sp.]